MSSALERLRSLEHVHLAARIGSGEQELPERCPPAHAGRQTVAVEHRLHVAVEALRALVQGRVKARLAEHVERGQRRGGRDRVAVQRAIDVGVVGLTLVTRVGAIDDGFATGDTAERTTAADDLAVGGQIRQHTEVLLRATQREPEPRHHLVEDEQHVVLVGDAAQTGEKPVVGEDHPLHRLDDDGGQLTALTADDLLHHFEVVVGRDQHGVAERPGHTAGVGRRLRVVGRPGRELAERSVVVVAVVGALELENAFPPGEGARHAHGIGGRLRTGGREDQLLGHGD